MMRKLPWILLAISLLANAGFLYGALQAQQAADRLAQAPEAREEAVAERLGLSEAQQAELEALRQRLRERLEADRAGGAREAEHERLMAELARPDYDRAAVEALLLERNAERAAAWADMSAEVHAFLQRLDPPQRETFLALAGEDRGFLRRLMFPHWGSRGG